MFPNVEFTSEVRVDNGVFQCVLVVNIRMLIHALSLLIEWLWLFSCTFSRPSWKDSVQIAKRRNKSATELRNYVNAYVKDK